MLHAEQLTCIYDERLLFQALTLTVNRGEMLQVSGDNGSGKTSLLRLLCGLARPESGVVSWQGEPLSSVRDAFHQQLLWCGHKPGVKAALTADENLRFFFAQTSPRAREEALAAMGLAGYEDVALSQLSAGQQRRVALTRLWLTSATLWILDEPFTALDATAVERLTRRLEQHVQAGGSVILTTHQPLRALACPLRTLRLCGGRTVGW
ncbi:TPA: cytochrome c biogenesis heme-transporting ATPase CcmA [Raoultella terrigena]|uniref:Cytochrome c biogenesis heme-transporting ATPase CcmA n=1 Tax=Raoultella terrigena TaxID=577 RepID=A0AAP9XV88_RAOTE|nr:cytochrome c biogenesis heme-transporting ATPase CcmA [Raoultella terrigena]QPF10798.1 cytochrome c biogenesis heme-transporting ATPase CcmA [Raoultella terrigena]